jgi:DNA-binding phage protein
MTTIAPFDAVDYLDAWLTEALGDIARAKGMSQVAKDAGL